jgi:hypothetical protein
MPNAIRKAQGQKPRPPKTRSFDYADFDCSTADQMRSAADRVRAFVRDSVVMVGLELLHIKETVKRGHFQTWSARNAV